jgi:3-deoxy-manno-octulosonate cytidylyltransferase (CMP-KDO synthetase)
LKILGIIPARYASTRLEGKPLLEIAGKTMIRRVYEQALKCKSLTEVIIATDDQRIIDECKLFDLKFCLTSTIHTNGTERCGEVLSMVQECYDIVVNIQGDEPFIHPESIDEIISIFSINSQAEIGTLIKKIDTIDYLSNPSIIKVVQNTEGKALYFSRSTIPFQRDMPTENWLKHEIYFKHIGMYAYRTEVLKKIIFLKESRLERIEKLEQLRWLENGYQIYVSETKHESKSIDTIEDYNYIIENISKYTYE